jgi:hypothetical protein
MTDQQLQPINVLPAKHFFHEAAHALALYSLGVTPVSMSVTMADDPRMTHDAWKRYASRNRELFPLGICVL